MGKVTRSSLRLSRPSMAGTGRTVSKKVFVTVDLRSQINSTPMSVYQWVIIGVASFLNALDGYDLVAMSFTSNAVSEEFALTGSQLGWLLSSALLGVGVGSILLAPLADRFGRKRLIIIALLIDLSGLILSTLSTNYSQLLTFRFFTGIGVGGILACVTVLVSEFSNLRMRGLAMSIYSAGYGLGATLCGVFAANFIESHGWQIIFAIGAALTAVAVIAAALFIPESPEALHARGQQDKINDLAHKLGKTPGAHSYPATSDIPRASFKDIVSPGMIRTTIAIWIAFGLITFGFNFANQWTPKLLTETGLTAQQGIIGGIMLSFGGTIGSLIFGAMTTRFDARRLLIAFSLGSAVVLVSFIYSTNFPSAMFALGVGVGMLLNGCVTGMYTITPQAYPFQLRATGVGTAIGVSRVGAVLGPLVVGYLVEAGWSPTALYIGAAIVVIGAAVALIGVREQRTTTVVKPEPVNA